MDAPAIREELRDMARRLGTSGYYVMLPNLYYRSGVMELGPLPADPEAPERKRMFELMDSLNIPLVMEDTTRPARLCRRPAGGEHEIVGAVGYCMSGRYAINAATHFPDRVKAAASIYGTQLATDQPDSPHLAASKTKAELYFACAETDIYAPLEIVEKVQAGDERAPTPRSRSIPAPITASPFPSVRSMTATPPSGIGSGCWRCIAAISPKLPAAMPFLLIAFPVFDPIAIAIGPIAIRWYALAYIGGIVLGWIYARTMIKNERLWGGPAPISLLQLDDFILWVTLGIILGGRTGYVLFYNLPFFIAAPRRNLRVVEGRHVVPWRLHGLRRRGDLVRRKNDLPILSLGDITTAVGPIGLFLGRIANFINSELWGRPADPSLPWAMVFPNGGPLPRHPSQLYEAGLEGIVLFTMLAVMIRLGALKRPGLILGSFIVIYGLARIIGEYFREPDPQLGFLWGGLTMGMLLSVPMIIAGRHHYRAWPGGASRPRPPADPCPKASRERIFAAGERDQDADQILRPDAGLALHGAVPDASAARLLRLARSAGARGRLHHRARSQPDVRRIVGLWAASVWKAIGSPQRCG